jgi:hypothetical protein
MGSADGGLQKCPRRRMTQRQVFALLERSTPFPGVPGPFLKNKTAASTYETRPTGCPMTERKKSLSIACWCGIATLLPDLKKKEKLLETLHLYPTRSFTQRHTLSLSLSRARARTHIDAQRQNENNFNTGRCIQTHHPPSPSLPSLQKAGTPTPHAITARLLLAVPFPKARTVA